MYDNRKAPLDPRRRGAVIVFTAVTMFTMIGFTALTVDVGYIFNMRAEMQNIADASALAGVSAIIEVQPDLARPRAEEYFARNWKRIIGDGDGSRDGRIIQLGTWSWEHKEFTPLFGSDIENADAVRVVGKRFNVPLFFAAIFGKNHTNISRGAVAQASRPCGGIWGLRGIDIPGNIVTDSYNSLDGPYSPVTAMEGGDLCSGRHIDGMGSFEVHGDAIAGSGHDVQQRGVAGLITGQRSSRSHPTSMTLEGFSDAEFNNDNATIGLTDDGRNPLSGGNDLRLQSDDNLALAGGTYYLNSLTMVGGSTITITGPTVIYMTGDLKMGGTGFINTLQDPSDFRIISSGSSIDLRGSADFYGTILAPYAEVGLGGTADYFGAVIGGTVKIFGDFIFHVDESQALYSMIDPPPPVLVQ